MKCQLCHTNMPGTFLQFYPITLIHYISKKKKKQYLKTSRKTLAKIQSPFVSNTILN